MKDNLRRTDYLLNLNYGPAHAPVRAERFASIYIYEADRMKHIYIYIYVEIDSIIDTNYTSGC